jgi:lipoprotein-releasing system ATP-binding protein
MLPARKLAKHSEEEIEHAAIDKLNPLGLNDQALKKANKLSEGQQQRVAKARALINNPKIIFDDDPTGNLDSKNSQNVCNILIELKQNFGQSILLVTHDMSIAQRADRIIILHDGEVVKN